MKLEIVNFDNYRNAIDVQKTIFPTEDGTINILASLDRELFISTTGLPYPDDGVKYYLARNDNVIIGIVGLYCEKSYPKDAWIGWFGVLPEFRQQGFGKKMLQFATELAQKQSYKTIRLYTDPNENQNAISLYEKLGFIGEKYTAEKLDYNCHIYSKSLTNLPVEPWNNRPLNLSYQRKLDHADSATIQKILNQYNQIN